jgi:GT2 family glycosyltransferase
MMPEVSVVVPNYNGEPLLPACLSALRAQTFRDFEIIVSDDGSTDGSVALVAERFPEAVVVRSATNHGFCRAANKGMAASKGEFIALLNNDTEPDPRYLEELAAAMRDDARVGICAAKMVYWHDPQTMNSAGHACGPDGVVVDIGRGEPDREWFRRPREVLGASGGAALYRRKMLAEIGGFDPDFAFSFEDADLNWRAQWAGWRARYVPTAVVRHWEGATRGIRSTRAACLGLRNTVHVWTKNWPTLSLLRHFPKLCSGLRRSAVSFVRRGHGTTLSLAAWGVFAQMPRMLKRRREIRRSRRVTVARFEELLAMGARQVRARGER